MNRHEICLSESGGHGIILPLFIHIIFHGMFLYYAKSSRQALCVSTCPSGAVSLVHKKLDELLPPAKDEMDWFEQRASQRGVDFSPYK